MSTHAITKLNHYRLLGRSGLRVSPLCLGTMTFGTEWGWGADESESRRIFDLYAERGGNFIDTANKYTEGASETYLGRLLDGRRDQFVLATKYTLNMRPGDPNAGGNHRKNIVQSLEASLQRLNTAHVDLYWLHMWDSTTPVDEVMRAFDDLVRAGKVLYAGVSDAPAWIVAQANTLADLRGWTRFVGLQIEYSLLLRDAERDLIPMAQALGLGVTPWSPLAGGVLSGKYTRADAQAANSQKSTDVKGSRSGLNAARLTDRNLGIAEEVKKIAKEIGRSPSQVALNWLLHQPGVTSPILGARTLDQFKDNLDCLDFALSADHLRKLDEASRIELGFPHDFLRNERVLGLVRGGAVVNMG